MWPVVAWISASVVMTAVTWHLASGKAPPRTSPWDLADNARKMVTIAGGLSAFTITGVVLLLSFAQQPGEIGTPLSSAVGMFLVSFMSLVTCALMYANQIGSGVVSSGVEIQSLQHSITTMTFYRSIFLGWLALRPLVEAYGLRELAEQVGWLLLAGSILAGLTMSVAILYRLGLVRPRVVVLLPLLALIACVVVALLFAIWPEGRSSASPLYLAYVLFAMNVGSFVLFAVIPPALEHPRIGPMIARSWGRAMAVGGVLSAMTIGFIWLATADLL